MSATTTSPLPRPLGPPLFAPGSVQLAAVPNAWLNDDLPQLGAGTTYGQILSEMALAGYAGSELGSTYPTDGPLLRRELERRGLRVSGAWVSTYFASAGGAYAQTLERFRRQLPYFEAVGVRDIYVAEVTGAVHQQPVPALANRPVFDDARWSALVRGLGELGRVCNDHGLRLNYHHHTGTAVQDNADVAQLMADTSAGEVWLLLDTAHITVGGGDALALARAHTSRIGHVHLKQVREPVLHKMRDDGLSFWDALVQGIFTVPGDHDGMLDLEPVLRVLAEGGFQGWLAVEAEQDPARANPLEMFRTARQWLAEVAGL
jgi:inosose dehydratase